MRAVCNHSVVTIRKVQPNLFKLKSISPFSQFAKCKEERTHFFFPLKQCVLLCGTVEYRKINHVYIK